MQCFSSLPHALVDQRADICVKRVERALARRTGSCASLGHPKAIYELRFTTRLCEQPYNLSYALTQWDRCENPSDLAIPAFLSSSAARSPGPEGLAHRDIARLHSLSTPRRQPLTAACPAAATALASPEQHRATTHALGGSGGLDLPESEIL